MKNILNKLNWDFFKTVPITLQSEVSECGLACITMLANFYGYTENLLSLRSKFPVSSKGLNLKHIQQILGSLGFESRALSLELNELKLLQKPCILHWDFNHFVILTKVTKKYVYLNDPAFGKKKLTFATVSKHFTGVALEIWPKANFKPSKNKKLEQVTLQDVIRNLREIKSPVIKILCLSIIIETIALFLPIGNQLLLDHVVKSNDVPLLIMICSILFFSNVFKAGLSMIRQWISIKMNTLISIQWSTSTLAKLFNIPLEFFEKRHLGDIKSRFSSLDSIYSTITSSINTFTVDLVVLVCVAVMMMTYNIFLFLIVVLFSFIYISIRLFTYLKFRQINEELIYKQAKRDSHFMESLYGIHTLKSLNLNNTRKEHWLSLMIDYSNTSIQSTKYTAFFTGLQTFISTMDEILILGLGIYMIMDNYMSLGMFVAFNAYRGMFSDNISGIFNKIIELTMLSIHYNRISEIVLADEEPESLNQNIFFSTNTKSSNILEVKNIVYGYDQVSLPILNNISFNVERGDSIAIIGPSGCGKTTLLKIMSGLLYPNTGSIIYNGIDIQKLGFTNYRDNIGCVLQEDHLFAGSLLMNIACFDKTIDAERVFQCATLANIHDEIMKMPMGYETMLGELGQGLSGGQKQRLFIARALYKKPDLLFLDESTSHLDIQNEQIVNANLAKLNITTIIVAHRESTINSANKKIQLA